MRHESGKAAAPASEDGLAQALEDYLEAAEAGTAPPREEFLARHPELAEQLDGCLAALRFIGRAAGGPRSVAAGVGEVLPLAEPASGTLGDFRLIREVGRGGMGVVYEAEQVSLGRRVALKVLPFAATMDPRQLQRFHNEARAAASLDHPHIVHVHAVGCERGVHYYAMQFIDGQTLAALIAGLRQRSGRPVPTEEQPTTPHVPGQVAPPSAETAPRAAASTERARPDRAHYRRVAEWGAQAAEALDHAHQLGIVHRDVKPANLLVDGRGGLWVTDFGLAHIQSDARLTMTGDLVGTLRYMSPEQALAKRVVVDHRTDVYSLGATLYELLTLEPVFTGNDRQELLRQIAFEEPTPPRRRNKAIPAELETIVLKAMEKNPADRYATAKELADDLRRFLADEPIRARPAGVVRRPRKWGRRHPAAVAATTAALTVAVVGLSGGIGWVANDRATRAQRTADEITTALKESADWQQRRLVPEALAAARRAKAALAGGHADAALHRRVEARVNDLELLAKLEEARGEGTAVKDSHSDEELTDRRCGEIFRQFNLDLGAGSAGDAGAHIRDSTVALELASFLDKWAVSLRGRDPQDEARWKPLLDVARTADPDGWRCHLRDALAGTDREALVRLASSDEVAHLLHWTVSALVDALFLAGAAQPAEALLRRVQQQHPDDFHANVYLGSLLANSNPPRLEEAIRFRMVALALRPQSPGAHLNLGVALERAGDTDGGISEFRVATRLKQDWALAHKNLGATWFMQGRLAEAEAAYRKAIEFRPDYAEAHRGLGHVLLGQGKLPEAEAACRQAIALKPDLSEAHYNFRISLHDRRKVADAIAARVHAEAYSLLGDTLRHQGKLAEAGAAYRQAIDLDPKLAGAHNNLGLVFYVQGKAREAEAQFREVIELEPDAVAHYNLGNALREQGKLGEAVAAYRKAIALKPDLAEAHDNLGSTWGMQGKLAEAEAACRKAIALKPDFASAHYNLGMALTGQGKLAEAETAYRKAIEIKPDSAESHCNLGQTLRDKGQFAEALSYLRRGHELGSKNLRWPYPSAQWVKQCERLVELDGKLPAVLAGKEQPANDRERAEYAGVYQKKRLYASAARLYREAITAQPELVASPANGIRYNAACTAALAGCGAGEDAAQLTDAERAALRQQALDWLRADLDAWRGLLDKEPDKARPAVAQQMQHWLRDPDFKGVRGPDALAKLPEAERPAWQQFWADVQRLLDRAAATPTPAPEKKA
jgi:serine/threonine protein kinase/tetratricopeptide (TPR) repeat protein